MNKNNDLLKKFDIVIEAISAKIDKMGMQKQLGPYLEKAKEARLQLVKAIEEDDANTANHVIDKIVAFGRQINKIEKKEITLSQFEKEQKIAPTKDSFRSKTEELKKGLFGLFGRKNEEPKKIERSPMKEKRRVQREMMASSAEYERELKRVEKELAKRKIEFQGLKGAYAQLSAEMAAMRRKMEAQQAKDVKTLAEQIAELKNSLDVLHNSMSKEFASSKDAYKDFSIELLHLAIKVAELEERLEKDDLVTEVDVLSLNQSVAALENKLSLIEANEKKKRLELISKIQNDQKKMLKQLESKADTQKIIAAMKQYVSELLHEIEERDKKIAAEMQVELKSSYYALNQKIKKIEEDLEKARTKKDLNTIRKKVEALSTDIARIKEEEMAIQQELKQQHLSDDMLFQKIDELSHQLARTDELDQIALSDVHKTIDALEMQLQMKPSTKEVKSMKASLGYLKNKLDELEKNLFVCDTCGKQCKNARGLFLHKKMAHRKKKPTKKPKKKTTNKKPKKLFGLLGD